MTAPADHDADVEEPLPEEPRMFWDRQLNCGYCNDVHHVSGRGCASPIRHVPVSELTPDRRRHRRVLS